MKPYTTWPKAVRDAFFPLTTKEAKVLHAARKDEPDKPVCGAKIPSMFGRRSREWSIVPGAEKDLCPKCAAIVSPAPERQEDGHTPAMYSDKTVQVMLEAKDVIFFRFLNAKGLGAEYHAWLGTLSQGDLDSALIEARDARNARAKGEVSR